MPGQLSEQLFRRLLHQLTDGSPFERSIGNLAGMVIAIAQHPRLADGAIAWQRCGEQVGQTPAAPEPILIDRFESQGIQDLTHGYVWSLSSMPSRPWSPAISNCARLLELASSLVPSCHVDLTAHPRSAPDCSNSLDLPRDSQACRVNLPRTIAGSWWAPNTAERCLLAWAFEG